MLENRRDDMFKSENSPAVKTGNEANEVAVQELDNLALQIVDGKAYVENIDVWSEGPIRHYGGYPMAQTVHHLEITWTEQ